MGTSACRLIRVFNIFAASFEISLSCNTSSISEFCWPRKLTNFNRHFKMSSGVAVDEECKNVYDKIKKSKSHRYVVFFIKDEKSIAVEKVGDRDASYDSFLTDLMQGASLSVDMVSMIWSTNINAKAQRKSATSKNCFWWLGVQILQESKRKCCTRLALMLSRNH